MTANWTVVDSSTEETATFDAYVASLRALEDALTARAPRGVHFWSIERSADRGLVIYIDTFDDASVCDLKTLMRRVAQLAVQVQKFAYGAVRINKYPECRTLYDYTLTL